MTDKEKVKQICEECGQPETCGYVVRGKQAECGYLQDKLKEPAVDDLEKEVDEYIMDNFDDAEGRVYVLQCARHFANWQKERIKKSLDLGEPPYLISIEQAYYRTIKLLED